MENPGKDEFQVASMKTIRRQGESDAGLSMEAVIFGINQS